MNYTTYDVQRGVDILHCSNLSETRNVVKPSAPEHHYGFSLDKSAVLVHSVGQSSGLPWAYAIVLGIFHAFVLLPDGNERRLEFLWVRWLDRDLSLPAGPTPRRLERLTLAPLDAPNAVDFIDPASVIRGCHLIPAFHHGRLPHEVFSLAHHSLGDWRFLYVNRCVLLFYRFSIVLLLTRQYLWEKLCRQGYVCTTHWNERGKSGHASS